jgi:hypothetical protein
MGRACLRHAMQGAFEQAWVLLKSHVIKAPLRHETVRRVNNDDFMDEYEGQFYDPEEKKDVPITFEHDKERGEMTGRIGDKDIHGSPIQQAILRIGSTIMPNDELVYHPYSPDRGDDEADALALHTDEDVRGRGYAEGLAEFLPHVLARNPDLKFSPFVDGFTDMGQSWIDSLQQKHPGKFRQLVEQHMPDYLPLQFAHHAIMNDHPDGYRYMNDAIKYINNAVGVAPTMNIDPDDWREELERWQEAMRSGQ